ncbi:C-GCAxxG-C-C family protein [Akkermansia sp. N21169]|uniref:C-GCAxxG-C-C family protein n=1 Tax=Akkermansia sp. N21169 TaxID=3040765 RepID=UPI00244EAD84|nr:C-GCAxxG-C-C family protein [Akkermansia sp. N21169]MDH3067898.1 C-GCAxxG-C-C family protein [Akkermansia sp. N21169]
METVASKLEGIPLTPRVLAALDYFHQGYNCSQSVFAAFADYCGLSPDAALRLSSPFGAGIGRMREVCGALCGASMIGGALKGNAGALPEEKERIFSLVREFAEAFKREFGSMYCRDLLHLESAEESARPSVRTAAYYASRPCERCVAFCAALADGLVPGEG